MTRPMPGPMLWMLSVPCCLVLSGRRTRPRSKWCWWLQHGSSVQRERPCRHRGSIAHALIGRVRLRDLC
eukprot:4036569-Prymnesium_polylepis.1